MRSRYAGYLIAAVVCSLLLLSGAPGANAAEAQKKVAPMKQMPIKRFTPGTTTAPPGEEATPPESPIGPDLTLGACEVLCDRGGGYSAQVCQQYGYSDQFNFEALSSIRNSGNAPASIEAGWRVWGATQQAGSGTPSPAGSPQHQASPVGGIYLMPGTDVPGSSRPVIYNLHNLAPGTYTVVFTADPENRVAETNENNNTSQCTWTVVAGTASGPYDLAITGLSVSPSSGPPTTDFKFTVKVKNLGGPTFTPIYTNCQPGAGFNNPKIEEDEEITTTYSIPGTMTPGQKTITCTVSSTSFGEQNTSNNSMSATFTVTQP